MKLIFVRHGDPDYEKDSLTEKGWREAEILAKRVAKWDIKQIYCSPMGRAKDTCSLSLKATGKEAVTCDWLQEFYYRVWDEKEQAWTIAWDFYPRDFNNWDELHDKDKWDQTEIMKSGDLDKHAQDVYKNFDALLEKHGYKRNDRGFYDVIEHNDDNIVFFCHFGITALIIGHLIGIAAPAIWQGMMMQPTSITVMGSEERIPGEASFRVQVFGDARHLIEAGEPISQSGYFTQLFEG
ncbi:MAG: histidine phosphatase family protein [Clostridiales bacterium]|nr:histidine phosphatase family protein [Clostridiales bacterium]MBR4949107.1 histidine phosphatase family protein [Clostridiales bacterium]